MIDGFGRRIEYLRISITDKCDLRCVYCMPESGVACMPHEDLLSYEEILGLVRIMTGLGVKVVRLTGGEPMVRKDCMKLMAQLHEIPGVERIAMTTNGILLKDRVREAREAGLDSINISLDTLDPERYHAVTRLGRVEDVLTTIRDALACGIRVKLNAVPIRNVNEEDLVPLAAMAREQDLDVRFIELMPVGCGAGLKPIPTDEVKAKLAAAFGELLPDETRHGLGPAAYVKPAGFRGSIGFISAMSHEFCDQCNRVRLTPEGRLKLCLNHKQELDLRALLRNGATDEELREAIRDAIAHKPQRHGFGENIEDKDSRRMNQIGG